MRRGEANSIGESGERAASLTFLVAEPSPRSGLNAGELIAAARGAGAAWEETCSEIALPKLVFVPGNERLPIVRDGMSVLRVRTGTWCPDRAVDDRDCYSRERAAITHRYPSESSRDNASSLHREADIEINAVHYSWGDSVEHRSPIGPVLVHELGHALGLGHSCEGPSCEGHAAVKSSVMYPDPLENRLLAPSAGDCRDLLQLYPSRERAAFAWMWLGFGLAALSVVLGALLLRRRKGIRERERRKSAPRR